MLLPTPTQETSFTTRILEISSITQHILEGMLERLTLATLEHLEMLVQTVKQVV
jgi:hypothetical protein